MRSLELAPFWRSTVGFDRLFDLVEDSLRWTCEDNYPPYDIVRTDDDRYAITLAVAGFAPDDITITAEQNMLTVEGRKTIKDDRELLYQGISARHFKRGFSLADFVQVENASLENGLLKIELRREVPEAMKPRRVAINGGGRHQRQQQDRAEEGRLMRRASRVPSAHSRRDPPPAIRGPNHESRVRPPARAAAATVRLADAARQRRYDRLDPVAALTHASGWVLAVI